jgi:hypothetical protein
MFNVWLGEKQSRKMNNRELIEDFFEFMNSRITLNKKLSKVFIEIWEIAAYNDNIRAILQQAYQEWISALSEMLSTVTNDPAAAWKTSAATVAFLEGMALFSIILTPDTFDFDQVLTGFQKKIIDSF